MIWPLPYTLGFSGTTSLTPLCSDLSGHALSCHRVFSHEALSVWITLLPLHYLPGGLSFRDISSSFSSSSLPLWTCLAALSWCLSLIILHLLLLLLLANNARLPYSIQALQGHDLCLPIINSIVPGKRM